MDRALRAVHYLKQFFGGIGGGDNFVTTHVDKATSAIGDSAIGGSRGKPPRVKRGHPVTPARTTE